MISHLNSAFGRSAILKEGLEIVLLFLLLEWEEAIGVSDSWYMHLGVCLDSLLDVCALLFMFLGQEKIGMSGSGHWDLGVCLIF